MRIASAQGFVPRLLDAWQVINALAQLHEVAGRWGEFALQHHALQATVYGFVSQFLDGGHPHAAGERLGALVAVVLVVPGWERDFQRGEYATYRTACALVQRGDILGCKLTTRGR